MIERRRRSRFLREALHRFIGADELRREDLECDAPREIRVQRLVHLAHAAPSEHREDLVMRDECAGR